MLPHANEALSQLASRIAAGSIEASDLSLPLSGKAPILASTERFGQCASFSRVEISRNDERGVARYWPDFTVGEHRGTHFDAPPYQVSGKDLPANIAEATAPADFVAPAIVIDCSRDAQWTMLISCSTSRISRRGSCAWPHSSAQ